MPMKPKPKRLPLKELQEIARVQTREALRAYDLQGIDWTEIVLGVVGVGQGEFTDFELYIPGARPEDARIVTRARVHAYTGEVSVQVFLKPNAVTVRR